MSDFFLIAGSIVGIFFFGYIGMSAFIKGFADDEPVQAIGGLLCIIVAIAIFVMTLGLIP